jgi:hypothetical protein
MVVECAVGKTESPAGLVINFENAAGVEHPHQSDPRQNCDQLSGNQGRIRICDTGPPEVEHLPSAQSLAGRLKRLCPLAQLGALMVADKAGRRIPGRAAKLRIRKWRIVLPGDEGLENFPRRLSQEHHRAHTRGRNPVGENSIGGKAALSPASLKLCTYLAPSAWSRSRGKKSFKNWAVAGGKPPSFGKASVVSTCILNNIGAEP